MITVWSLIAVVAAFAGAMWTHKRTGIAAWVIAGTLVVVSLLALRLVDTDSSWWRVVGSALAGWGAGVLVGMFRYEWPRVVEQRRKRPPEPGYPPAR